MFPLSDTAPRRRFPFVNWLIIAANVAVFYFEVTSPNLELFVEQFAFIPSTLSIFEPKSWGQLFTSFWLHGSLLHIASNMWFLHIFGDNVEDKLGHFVYLAFYIVAGITANLIQYLFGINSMIPMLGASGAVAGVLGAYFLYFRDHRVKTLVITPIGFFTTIKLSSVIFIGIWFVLQFLRGIGTLGLGGEDVGGIAYFAHIGGFLAGLVLGKVLNKGEELNV